MRKFNSSMKISIEYKNQTINTLVNPAFATPEVTVSGGLIFNSGLAKWVGVVVADKLYTTIETKLGALLAIKEKAAMDSLFTIENEITDPQKISVVYNNGVIDVQVNPSDFVSFGFMTTVRTKNFEYSRTLKKKLNTSISMTGITSKLCLSTDIITASMELVGKMRDESFEVHPKELGITRNASSIYPLMPKLREMYSPSEKIYIKCRQNKYNHNIKKTIRLTTKSTSNESASFDYPYSCYFNIHGDDVLNIDFFTKPTLTKIAGSSYTGMLNVNTSFYSDELYYHKIYKSKVPVNLEALFGISNRLMEIIKTSITPLSKGVLLPKLVSTANYEPEFVSFEETCFNGVQASQLLR